MPELRVVYKMTIEQRKGRWEDWEKDYLFKHANDSTDAELASHLGRSKTSITEMRRKLQIKKNSKQRKPEEVTAMIAKHQELKETTSVADLDAAQQRRFHLNNLVGSPTWADCLLMFDDQEREIYKTKHVETMMTLETVNEIEKGNIHVMLMSFIRMNRYMKLEKEYRDMAEGGDPELAAKAISFHQQGRDATDVYMKAQDELSASRKQRVKEEGDQRLNIVELINELDARDAREKLGREADALAHIQNLEKQRLTDGGYIRGE